MNEVLLRFWVHAKTHYRHRDGRPTSEIHNYNLALRPLRELYGMSPAEEFGPLALKVVRQHMIEKGWCRTAINGRVGRVRRVFKWAASEEIVPVPVYQALCTVSGLQAGRSDAVERDPVRPVADEHVDATLPFLTRHVAGLVQFQRLTGCRPGEACALRRSEIDPSGKVWLYRPVEHKLAYRGKARVIAIGPKAQSLLASFFPPEANAHVFSPARAVEELRRARSDARKTPRYPSHMRRNVVKRRALPLRKPGDCYSVIAYGHAIRNAVAVANKRREEEAKAAGNPYTPIPRWHPSQLRHLYATHVRRTYGLEAAQVMLGHSKADVTQVYAERNEGLARDVADVIG